MNRITVFLVWTSFITAVAIIVRFDNLSGHFTHTDDLLIAKAFRYDGRIGDINWDLTHGIPAEDKEYFSSDLYKKMKSLYDSPWQYKMYYNWMLFKDRFWRITRGTTYAPLQCSLVSTIVNFEDREYEKIKWEGRLFSCLFGIGSVIVMILFLYKLYQNEINGWMYALMGGLLLACSWEDIIYSQQMEPYSIAVFLHGILLLMLVRFGKSTLNYLQCAIVGLLFGFLVWGQYQLLFCGVAALAALFLYHLNLRTNTVKYLVLAIFFSIAVYPLLEYIIERSGGGVNWNVGAHWEFYFPAIWTKDIGLFPKLIESILFFPVNTYYTFRSMLSFYPDENSILFNLVAGLLYLTMHVGIYSFFRQWKNKTISNEKRLLLYYLLVFSVIWIILLIVGKLALSPTRHSMVLIPIFILLVAEGISWISNKRSELVALVLPVLAAFILFMFSFTYGQEKELRKDIFSQAWLDEQLVKYGPDLIMTYEFTENIHLMNLPDTVSHIHIASTYGEVEAHAKDSSVFSNRRNEIRKKLPQVYMMISSRALEDEILYKASKNLLGIDLQQYELVHSYVLKSQKEIEYSNLTYNGRNDQCLAVYKRR